MLRSLNELYGYKILARDGEIGRVHDFYFDEQEWKIRYLVVDTGPWILGRKVLISPVSLGQPDWNEQIFPVKLTRDQIKNSPDIDTEQPVSRQQELDLNLYFQWPTYWASPFSPSPGAYAAVATDLETIKEREAVATARRKEAEKYVDKDSQVRRGKEVIGYRVDGSDGLLGQVEDFILEDRSWKIWYLVLDADDLVNDKLVLISPLWIQWIRFDAKNVRIDLPRQNIIDCPAFDPSKPIRQEQEEVLHDFHGKPYYWNKRSLKN